MSSQTHNQAKQRRDDEQSEQNSGAGAPPQKRRMTSTSPAGQSAATTSSIFGGRAKDEEGQQSLAAETRDGGMAPVGSRVGSGADSSPATATAVERGGEPVDRAFSERIVTVLVGPSRTTWRLHENLLSCASDFFRSAFHAGFKETLEDQLALPEDDPHTFELFVRWLYARAVAPPGHSAATLALQQQQQQQQQQSTLQSQSQSQSPAPVQTWLRLYAFACKIMIEELENICVDAVGRYYSVGMRRPDIRDVQYIYEHTPDGSGMRRLLKERLTLGMFRGRQNNPVTAEWREVLNETPDLGFDIVSEISGFHWINGGNVPARTASQGCVFHRHEKGEPCRPG